MATAPLAWCTSRNLKAAAIMFPLFFPNVMTPFYMWMKPKLYTHYILNPKKLILLIYIPGVFKKYCLEYLSKHLPTRRAFGTSGLALGGRIDKVPCGYRAEAWTFRSRCGRGHNRGFCEK